jgi:hypothetical protein
MADCDYTFTPDGGTPAAVTWSEDTSFEDLGAGRRLFPYDYQGIDGRDYLDNGWVGKRGKLTTWLSAASEAALQATKATAEALVGKPGSLSLRGGADSWTYAAMVAAPEYSEHYKDALGGGVGIRMVLTFEQLAPNA